MKKKPTPKKRPAHRPTAYTAQLAAKLCEAIALGSTVDEGCKRVGIAPATFYDWSKHKPEFSDAVLRAKDERLNVLEETWARAGRKDWRAAEAMLKVLKSGRFANRLHLELDGEYRAAVERLKRVFAQDKAGLEKALAALVGEDDGSPPTATAG